ncbi:hypothetical protein AX14_006038 [Amanita brunnescens Koide BX004]|nr:hypothetical protein AX14_006038 [Amanita brunnescens Koide BX004]
MDFLNQFSHLADDHSKATNPSAHKLDLTHGLIAAAAAYEGAKAYQDHLAKHGKPSSHAEVKNIIAAGAGALIDQLVETKGLDLIDKAKAKHDATKQVAEKVEVVEEVQETIS